MKSPAQVPRMAQLGLRDPGRREGLCPGRFLGGRLAFPQIGPTRGYKVAWNAVEREPKECAGLPARPSILSARRRALCGAVGASADESFGRKLPMLAKGRSKPSPPAFQRRLTAQPRRRGASHDDPEIRGLADRAQRTRP